MAVPSALAYAGDQSLQVSSGVRVLPERVAISSLLPAGVCDCHLIVPQSATVGASRTSEV